VTRASDSEREAIVARLREAATLASPEVRITVISLLGGSDIIVPEGVHAELSSFALFGGDDLKLEGPEPPPGHR
jgi:hypothetical protein